MSYIGRGTENISNVEVLDNLTFNGSASYTLQKSSTNFVPSSANNLLISISGVVQQGNFSVSGSTITFDTTVSASDTCDWILHYGTGLITTVADGAITEAKLGSNAVTTAKINNGAITSAKLDSGLALGKVNQRISSSKFSSGSSTSTSTTYVSTPVTANITPSATSSNIMIAFTLGIYKTGGDCEIGVRVLRTVGGVDTEVIETGSLFTSNSDDNGDTLCVFTNDAPNTTSQVTYTVQFRRAAGGGTVATNIQTTQRAEMTLMEVLA